jgi:hypothetical protein
MILVLKTQTLIEAQIKEIYHTYKSDEGSKLNLFKTDHRKLVGI